jgi:hypothetical protein
MISLPSLIFTVAKMKMDSDLPEGAKREEPFLKREEMRIVTKF